SVERQPMQTLRRIVAVFTKDDAPSRADANVVGRIENVGRWRLVNERQPLLLGIIKPDLALLGVSAACRNEVRAAVAPPTAFKPGEGARALGLSLRVDAQVVVLAR